MMNASNAAFCAPLPTLSHPRTRRPRPRVLACCEHASQTRLARRAAAAAAAVLVVATSIGDLPSQPPCVDAMGLAPTPINPYAKRRADKAYKEYLQILEERMEELPLGDLKKVVQEGGGGLSVGYRVAGFAAFVAATISVIVVHPIDSVKTRLQAGTTDAHQLFSGVYRGVFGNVLKEAPNAAIYLGVYEVIKTGLMATPATSFFRDLPLLTFLIAGALGDAVGSVVRVPAEVINKRLQLGLSSDFLGALRDIFASSSGLSSLREAWGSVLLRDVPFGGIQIMLYELGKQLVDTHAASLPAILPTQGLASDIMVGSIVGAFTAFITTPADVLVTRISLASGADEDTPRMGPMAHLRALWTKSGLAGLFAGSTQRAAYYFVMSALFFGLYEKTSHLASHPALVSGVLANARDLAGAQVTHAMELFTPGVVLLPPETWSAAMYIVLHEIPLLLSLLTIQG